MGFFDRRRPEIEDDAPDDEDEPEEPAAKYLGGVIPVEALVARSESAAVAVRNIVAYPDGFEFTLELWVRGPKRSHVVPGPGAWGPFMLHPFERGASADPAPELVRFGIEFPDGVTVTNLDTPSWQLSPDATEPEHGMQDQSGSGSDDHYEQTYWAWPIPAGDEGAVAFVCEWPAYDIAETRYEIGAAEIRRAADRAQAVWPDLGGPSHPTRSAVMRGSETRRSQRRQA